MHCGRSLPPGGERIFEIQVDRVGEHGHAILHLKESPVLKNPYKDVEIKKLAKDWVNSPHAPFHTHPNCK